MSLKLLLTFFVGVLLFSNLAFAIPGVPHVFYGTVTLNNQPAPDGTSIVAKIAGIQVASTTTKDGKYGYDPVFYIDDPNNDRSGKEIKFFVNGIEVNTGPIYFCNGCVGVADNHQPLDLAVTVQGGATTTQPFTGSYIPQTTTTTPPSTTTLPTTTTIMCQERWVCTNWSACGNGLQTRTCTDEINCGTDLNKPLESQPCTTTEGRNQTTGGTVSPITGFFAALTENPLYYIGIGVLVILIIVVFISKYGLYYRRK